MFIRWVHPVQLLRYGATFISNPNIVMLKEFKNFILKGNVVDLSTGVIIGAAFGAIVSSFTKGIVEPILALAGNGPNPKLTIPITDKLVEVAKLAADGKPVMENGKPVMEMVKKVIELDLGIIIGAVISFLITAAVVFFVIVKPVNKLLAMSKKAEAEAPPAAPPADIALLTEIRDLLKK
jgi:large conductance mechanosensitive channel